MNKATASVGLALLLFALIMPSGASGKCSIAVRGLRFAMVARTRNSGTPLSDFDAQTQLTCILSMRQQSADSLPSCTLCACSTLAPGLADAAAQNCLSCLTAGRELHGFWGDLLDGIGNVVNDVVDATTDFFGNAAGGATVAAGAILGDEDIINAADDVNDAFDEAGDTLGDAAEIVTEELGEAAYEILRAVYEGRKCWAAVRNGMAVGSLAGPAGTAIGATAGALIRFDDCKDAFKYGVDAAGAPFEAGYDIASRAHCYGSGLPVSSDEAGGVCAAQLPCGSF